MQSTPLQLSKPQIEPFGPNLHDAIVTTTLTGRPALQQFCLGLSGKKWHQFVSKIDLFLFFFHKVKHRWKQQMQQHKAISHAGCGRVR